PNIARIMSAETVDCMARTLNEADSEIEAFLLPAIFGMTDTVALDDLRAKVRRPVFFIPTMPTSVPGVRSQIMLRSCFQRLGGTYLLGDNVTGGDISDGQLRYVTTANLGSDRLEADNFILASGSFLSHGIKSVPDRIYEPVFDLDVTSESSRSRWFGDDFYETQPYMDFGVVSDKDFRLSHSGHTISNLYGVGAVLEGCDAITLGCGGGVALLTAIHVADTILKQ
ncbi:MAG: anaerobic glycerol-3-phosphate dehydrogenase subunit B, partial [Muribaculaceae bacterium]|nr:anaerobic glycerol-3-phosphate dehydrogenase subunit B [Muribaculaceae bacterium]